MAPLNPTVAVPTAASMATVPPATPTLNGGAGATPTSAPSTPLPPYAGARSIGDPYAPELGNGGYQVQHYDLSLELDPAAPVIRGTARLDAVSTQADLRQLSLDLVGFTVSEVLVEGRPALFSRPGDKLVIDLPEALPAGTPFSLSVTYQGQPALRPSRYLTYFPSLGLTFPGDGSVYTFGEPDGARFWFPANDHPRDKASFKQRITVPAGLTAVSNGWLQEEIPGALPDGRPAVTFVWDHPFPMAPYLALVAVGDYVRLEGRSPAGIPLRHYVFPELVDAFEPLDARSGQAVDWLSERFGPYPFAEFGYVTARVRRLSLETQGMVLLSEQMLSEDVMVHELAHMWFGNWVSIDSWADMWLKEGLATYIAAMWLSGDDPAALEAAVATMSERVAAESTGLNLDELPPEALFGVDSYLRGAVLMHQLRGIMGDEAFFAGLRQYVVEYGGSSASQAEFVGLMSAAAGQSLDDFFARWLGPVPATGE